MVNIAVVVLDTLRKDAFDEHFEWLPGKRFENAWSTSHWTVPAHASLFTGRYPSVAGSHAKSLSLRTDESTLAEQLNNAGFTTRAFSCNPYFSPEFGFDRGFEHFTGSWRLRMFDEDLFDWNEFITESREYGVSRYPRALLECLRSDCATLGSLAFGAKLKLRDIGVGSLRDDGAYAAREWAKRTSFGQDEFVVVNLMEAHTPYNPPSSYQRVEPPNIDMFGESVTGSEYPNGERVRQAYDDSVRYLSTMYEEIFGELETSFDYVITVGDHGEMLGELGKWGHNVGIHPELVNVPLSIYDGIERTGSSKDLVSILDIYRTVLNIANVENSNEGVDLREKEGREKALVEYHGLQPRLLEQLGRLDPPGRADFDRQRYGIALDNGYYGYQTVDGFVECGTPTVDDPENLLDQQVSSLEKADVEPDSDLADDVVDQLKDLGYA